MSRKPKGSVWEYLKSVPGLLERGDKDEIAAERQKYWRIKNAEYQRARRTKVKEIRVAYTPAEMRQLARDAHMHNSTLPDYIRKSSLAHASQGYVAPDVLTLRKIEALMLRSLTAIERIAAKERRTLFGKGNYEEVRNSVNEMRAVVRKELTHPDLILRAVANNPQMWAEIKKIVQ